MKTKNPSDSPIKDQITVCGTLVTFHQDGSFLIHAKSMEQAQKVQRYLIDEGVFEMEEGSPE
jgi:hypothetical protein